MRRQGLLWLFQADASCAVQGAHGADRSVRRSGCWPTGFAQLVARGLGLGSPAVEAWLFRDDLLFDEDLILAVAHCLLLIAIFKCLLLLQVVGRRRLLQSICAGRLL